MTTSSDRLLALDASSSTIGYALMVDGRFVAHGTIALPKRQSIGARCAAAHAAFGRLWAQHGPTRLAIEKPAYAGAQPLAMVAQQRVMGAILLAAWEKGLAEPIEVASNTAKKALSGNGRADKAAMLLAARSRVPDVADEHAADALGVALGALL